MVQSAPAWSPRTRRFARVAGISVIAALAAVPASGQRAEVDVGVLSCTLEQAQNNDATPAATGATRDALCTFRARNGLEESYVGLVEGVTLSAEHIATAMWVVKGTTEIQLEPGVLQQNYVVEQGKQADQLAPLLGTTNPNLVLHAMADAKEGSASEAQKPRPTGYIIVGIQLKLKATQA